MKKLLLLLLFASFWAQGQDYIPGRVHHTDSIGTYEIFSRNKAESDYLHLGPEGNKVKYKIIDNFALDYFYPVIGTLAPRINGRIPTEPLARRAVISGNVPVTGVPWADWFDTTANADLLVNAGWDKKVRINGQNVNFNFITTMLENGETIMYHYRGYAGDGGDVVGSELRIERFGNIEALRLPIN